MTITVTENELPMNDVEAAAILLSGHPDFRVLKRISGTADLALPALGADGPFKIGVAVDIETTGLDSSNDIVIELAVQRFKFDGQGRIVEVGLPRSWLQDPGFPLEPEITRITGLTDADLQGQAIDDVAACNLLNSADLVIAHNAGFDRGFIEARLPAASGLPWACSMAGVPWHDLGFEGRSQSALLMQAGWFYTAHRAEADVAALLHLLAHVCNDGDTVLSKVVAGAERTTVRVEAHSSAYELKDLLKLRGYRWNAEQKCWWTEIDEGDLVAEQLWLQRRGYNRSPTLTHLTARERYL